MKTRLSLIIAILLLLNCAINAQNKTNLEISYSNLFIPEDNFQYYWPLGLCVEPTKKISNKLQLNSGIGVYYKRYHEEGNLVEFPPYPPYEWISNRVIIGIPINLKYQFLSLNKFGMYAKIGGKEFIELHFRKYKDYPGDDWNANFYNAHDEYANLGLGGSYKLNEKVSLFCESNGLVNWNQYGYVLDNKIGGIFNIK